MKKIIFLFILMIILSYMGQAFSAHFYQFKAHSFQSVLSLLRTNLLFILVVNVVIYSLEMLRLHLIGRAFMLHLNFKDCFGAVSLNILFAWITPGAILGAPALAYYLYRKGYPLAESLTIAFIRSFSIIFVSAITTILVYSFNLQEIVVNQALIDKIFYVLMVLAIYISSIVALSYLPLHIRKKVKFIESITTQVRKFLANGKLLLFPILGLGALINFFLVSFIPYVTSGYYENLTPLISQTMLFLSYLLLMPTPGASGLAEIGAPAFFSQNIPLQEMISTVTAMRISTIGIQIVIGIMFMFYFFKRNISLRELSEFKRSKMKTSADDLREQ